MDIKSLVPVSRAFGTWPAIALILSILGGILLYIYFVKPKKIANLKPNIKKFKEFLNFDRMVIEDIIKVVYLITTFFVILNSFTLITVDFGYFFLQLLIGPIVIRIGYEILLILISIWQNIISINKKIK